MDNKGSSEEGYLNKWTFGISGGFFVVFVITAIIDLDFLGSIVDVTFNWSAKWFGAYWEVLVLLTFLVAIVLALTKYGTVRLGGDEPEISTFSWIAMIMTALLAGGGVFWSAAEPMYHFLDVPPFFEGIEASTEAAIAPAFSFSFLHWGFLAWAILGTLATVVLMDGVHQKGLPLQPRTLLHPLLGEKGVYSPLGAFADITSIIAVGAGTIGPIGFLGYQLSYALETVFGIPDVFVTQLAVVVAFTIFYTLTAVIGLHDGISRVADFSAKFALFTGFLLLVFGPTLFIIDSVLEGFGSYLDNFFYLNFYRADGDWLGLWTAFFWAWFIGFAPMMAIFVARISKGRTIRQIVGAVAVISPIVTNFWFGIIGGTGIFYELENPGSISEPLYETGMAAALLDIMGQVPLSIFFLPAFVLLIVLFLATTGNSKAYTMSMVVTDKEVPPGWVRAFYGTAMGAVALVLMRLGGVQALQEFIVVTAVPVSILLLPSLWDAPRIAMKKYARQNGELPESEE